MRDERTIEFPHRGTRLLFILVQSKVIVFNCLVKIPSSVLTSSSRIRSIDVIRVNLQHSCEILNTLL
jgi:hypothetical protein